VVLLLAFHVISVIKPSVLEKNLSNIQHRNTVDNNEFLLFLPGLFKQLVLLYYQQNQSNM
jgi:hypothetical protein